MGSVIGAVQIPVITPGLVFSPLVNTSTVLKILHAGEDLTESTCSIGTSLRQLDLDNFTVSEILRLHFLGSGSEGSTSDAKFRWQQRGGYVSSDDAGLEFRREQPELLQTLASGNLFDMSSGTISFHPFCRTFTFTKVQRFIVCLSFCLCSFR